MDIHRWRRGRLSWVCLLLGTGLWGACQAPTGQVEVARRAVDACARTSRAALSDMAAAVLQQIEDDPAVQAMSPVPIDRVLSTCNHFESVQIDGPAIYATARDVIAAADHEVAIAFYKWDADSHASTLIGDGLIAAQARRTASDPLLVRIIVDGIDHPGSGAIYDLWESQKLWESRGLDTSRVTVQLATWPRALAISPNLHDKIIVVDARRLLITGSQPERAHDPLTSSYPSGWHDSGYFLEGDAAQSAISNLEGAWHHGDAQHWECQRNRTPECFRRTPFPPSSRAWVPPFGSQVVGDIPVLAVGRRKDHVGNDRVNNPQDIAWLTAIERAQSHIDIETPNINDDAFRAAILQAIERGVDVRLITSMGFNDVSEEFAGGHNLEVVADLRAAIRARFPDKEDHFQLRWYSQNGIWPVTGNGSLASHTKYLTADDRIAIVGTGNQDEASWHVSHEINVLIDDAAVTRQLQDRLFLPDWNRAIKSYVELYENNQGSTNLLCAIDVNANRGWRFTDGNLGPSFECDNDEARSAVLHDVPAGKVLRFYDEDGQRYIEDDWAEVVVKRPIHRRLLPSFEQPFEDDDLRVIVHRHNGLDGKISSADVAGVPTGPVIDLHEGNDGTQGLVCSNRRERFATIDFTADPYCNNDEARSLVLHDFPASKAIFLHDDSGGDAGDDWAVIVPKRDIAHATVGSFDRSFETDDFKLCAFPRDGLDGRVSRMRVAARSEAAGICDVACEGDGCLPALPAPNHAIDFGYYYVDGKYGDHRNEVNCYTNLYYALAVHNYFSDTDWWPLFQQSLENAVAAHKRIHLNINWDAVGGEMPRLLDLVAPFWPHVARVEMQDEPGWSRAQTESNIAQLRSMLAQRGLAGRPIGIVYTQNQVRFEDAIFADGLDWVGLEAYVNPPGSASSSDNVAALNQFLDQAKSRVPADKNLVLVMMAYDRNGGWTNMQTLRDLQVVPYMHAFNDPRVLAITMFSYARPGGTRDHPELAGPHRQIAEALGLGAGTCESPDPTPPPPPPPPPSCTKPRPTERPTTDGPTGCFGSPLNPHFEWSAVADASEYKLAIFEAGEDPGNDPLVFYEVVKGTSIDLPRDLTPERRYRWKVKGQNCKGDGPFSETKYFTISSDCRPPDSPPVLAGPRGCVDAVRPAFSWSRVPRASGYRIVVSPADRDDFFIDQFVTGPSLISPVALNPRIQYRFKVRAVNDAGIGPWSDSVYFTPFCGGVASLITAPLGCIESQTPTFTWQHVGAAIEYWLVVADTNDFNNPAAVWSIDAHLTGTSLATPAGVSFQRGKTYYAKVKTLLDPSSTTAAAWSPTVSFTPFCPLPPPPPPSPPVPVVWVNGQGVTIDAGSLTKAATTTGWDAGATSRQAIAAGDGYVEVTVTELTTARMFGLSRGDSDQGYVDIDFGLYPFWDGNLYLYEGGESKGALGPYAPGDRLRVSVESGVVRYRRNGVLLRSSTRAPSYPLLLDTSLYSPGARLTSAVIAGVLAPDQPPVASTGGPYSGVAGRPVTLNGRGSRDPEGSALSYSWDFGDGSTGTGPAPQHSYASAGAYALRLTVVDDAGLTATASSTVNVGTPVTWTSPVGVTVTGNSLAKAAPTSEWDAGAASREAIASGDGHVELTVNEVNSVRMAGLSKGNDSAFYAEIDFAIYPYLDGNLYIYEGGVYKGAFGPYAPGDRLRVSVESGQVRYRRNGVLLYTSATAPSYPLLVDTSLHSPAATIADVVIAGTLMSAQAP
jgi:phosphatidylserine/phosphatidylglycerophosphate/cardiolipin synthase-like enzyme